MAVTSVLDLFTNLPECLRLHGITAGTQHSYLRGMSSAFYSLADVELLVEDRSLPAHKALLAGNSPVLADLLASACDQATGTPNGKTEVPLYGESVKDVALVLKYLYRHFTFKYQTGTIQSVDDAKYHMEQMLYACEKFLISQVSASPKGWQATVALLVSLTILAEQCGLHTLLAHCENLLVQQDDVSLWQCEAVISGQISQGRLSRMLRAFQMQRTQQQRAEMQFVPYENCARGQAMSSSHYSGLPSVTDMLKWQSLQNQKWHSQLALQL